jgi:hypothetical protein
MVWKKYTNKVASKEQNRKPQNFFLFGNVWRGSNHRENSSCMWPTGERICAVEIRDAMDMLHYIYIREINLNTAQISVGLQTVLTARLIKDACKLRDLHNIAQNIPHTGNQIQVSIKTREFCYHRSVFYCCVVIKLVYDSIRYSELNYIL